jgi:hypothetical protein
MSNIRRIGASMRQIKAQIRRLPITVAHVVARQVAPIFTHFAQLAFDTGRNVYGDTRPAGVDGRPLSLVATGTTRRVLRFVANGTIVRAELGPRYARYLVGKYKILPVGDRTALPIAWVRAIDELVATAIANPERLAA